MKKFLCFAFSLLSPLLLFAEEEALPATRQQNMWQTFMMIGVALVFFYLILWRPEQKRRKKMENKRQGLAKGDRVTAMGIVGTVARLEANTVILKMVDGAKIEVLKSAITDVQPAAELKTTASEPQPNGSG